MRKFLLLLLSFLFCGCATWSGIKQDTKEGVDWSKEKVNKGASYIKEKTE
ncbi:MAG: hypothetical protein PHN38_06105 [Sulfurospirillaceae bacterium]|nr:hypothetical protein [Sulfurospirillaceae bacterium]MDD3462234.1 hypothetical protein [Sulfurospirillaceae bacterium]